MNMHYFILISMLFLLGCGIQRNCDGTETSCIFCADISCPGPITSRFHFTNQSSESFYLKYVDNIVNYNSELYPLGYTHPYYSEKYPFRWSNGEEQYHINFKERDKCLILSENNPLDSLDITDTTSFTEDTLSDGLKFHYPITDYHYQQAVPCSTLQTSAGVPF